MKIVVSRTGGVAGVTRRWAVEIVDEGAERSDWLVLIDACPWGEEESDASEPDRFLYVIRVDDREARLPERRVNGPWRQLVNRVRTDGHPLPIGAETAEGGHDASAKE